MNFLRSDEFSFISSRFFAVTPSFNSKIQVRLFVVTLPRFVGGAIGDCRNSGTSEFIRIVKRQSGVPVRHARREDMKYPNLGRIEKNRLQ